MWRLKELNKTQQLEDNIKLKKKQEKLCVLLLFRRKIVFAFCLLVLEKPLSRFPSFETCCIHLYSFATERYHYPTYQIC